MLVLFWQPVMASILRNDVQQGDSGIRVKVVNLIAELSDSDLPDELIASIYNHLVDQVVPVLVRNHCDFKKPA